MRNLEEIRSSIKELIEKAENEGLLKADNIEGISANKAIIEQENSLSDEILEKINTEVSEFQKAFKKQGAEGLIAQSIKDTIKPILDEWLKTNLPIIVSEVIDDKINEIRKRS